MNVKLRKRSLIFVCIWMGVALIVFHLDWLTMAVAVTGYLLYRHFRHLDEPDCNPARLQALRQRYHERKEEQASRLLQAVKDYSVKVMAPHLTAGDLRLLLFNIEQWNLTRGGPLSAVSTHTRITRTDLRHFAWNIGERLGWSGPEKAGFIKQTFHHQMEGLDTESIRRTLRKPGRGDIPLDVPEKGDWTFRTVTPQ